MGADVIEMPNVDMSNAEVSKENVFKVIEIIKDKQEDLKELFEHIAQEAIQPSTLDYIDILVISVATVLIGIYTYWITTKNTIIAKNTLNQTKISEYRNILSNLINFANESNKLFEELKNLNNQSTTPQEQHRLFLYQSKLLSGYSSYLLTKNFLPITIETERKINGNPLLLSNNEFKTPEEYLSELSKTGRVNSHKDEFTLQTLELISLEKKIKEVNKIIYASRVKIKEFVDLSNNNVISNAVKEIDNLFVSAS